MLRPLTRRMAGDAPQSRTGILFPSGPVRASQGLVAPYFFDLSNFMPGSRLVLRIGRTLKRGFGP